MGLPYFLTHLRIPFLQLSILEMALIGFRHEQSANSLLLEAVLWRSGITRPAARSEEARKPRLPSPPSPLPPPPHQGTKVRHEPLGWYERHGQIGAPGLPPESVCVCVAQNESARVTLSFFFLQGFPFWYMYLSYSQVRASLARLSSEKQEKKTTAPFIRGASWTWAVPRAASLPACCRRPSGRTLPHGFRLLPASLGEEKGRKTPQKG